MTDLQPILNRLVIARKNAGLSQWQAAKLLGYETGGGLSMIESGDRGLDVQLMLTMCEIYDVDTTWVITGINPAFDPQPLMEAAQRTRMNIAELGDLLELLASLKQEQTP